MTTNNEELTAEVIDGAEEVLEPAASEERGEKPRLLVESCSPDQTVAALRDHFAGAGGLYDRGVPVRLAFDQIQRGTVAQMMTPDALVLMAHGICRPYVLKAKQDGTVAEVNARLLASHRRRCCRLRPPCRRKSPVCAVAAIRPRPYRRRWRCLRPEPGRSSRLGKVQQWPRGQIAPSLLQWAIERLSNQSSTCL